MAAKIAVTGPIEGHLSSTFTKLSKIHSKTGFSFAIALGDLFATPGSSSLEQDADLQSLLSGDIAVALPTYFTIGNSPLPRPVIDRLSASPTGELAPNLIFLGKRGTTKTSEGIRIVALGGTLDPTSPTDLSKDPYLPLHTDGDAKTLHGVRDVHLLITSAWPARITNGSTVPAPALDARPAAEECLAQLCTAVQPRYHLSPLREAFYERAPFSHPPPDPSSATRRTTRFLGIAAPASAPKARWLYAFSLDPAAAAATLPPGTTPSPLLAPASLPKRPHSPPRQHMDHRRGAKRRRGAPPGPDECFFCLSNPTLATHLVVSIADDAYVTTARGPLVPAHKFASLAKPTPLHLLLIPLAHTPTLAGLEPAETRRSTYNELRRYRSALRAMLVDRGAGQWAAVCWEISRARVRHISWQWCAVPVEKAREGLVEAAFRVEAENHAYPAFKTREAKEGEEKKLDVGDYFRAWIWTPSSSTEDVEQKTENGDAAMNGTAESGQPSADSEASRTLPAKEARGKDVELVMHLDPGARFDIQFGRRVMGKLLGHEDRLDWKTCVQSEDEECAEAEAFKEAFGPWDFARDGE